MKILVQIFDRIYSDEIHLILQVLSKPLTMTAFQGGLVTRESVKPSAKGGYLYAQTFAVIPQEYANALSVSLCRRLRQSAGDRKGCAMIRRVV
jgi:hypothetical protein